MNRTIKTKIDANRKKLESNHKEPKPSKTRPIKVKKSIRRSTITPTELFVAGILSHSFKYVTFTISDIRPGKNVLNPMLRIYA